MASIPENVRILWPSSASTPSGWTTDSAFNDIMPYSANSGSGTGGANTHNHSGNSHSHPGGSHSHSTSVLGLSPNATVYNLRWYQEHVVTWGRCDLHYHPASSVGSTTTSGSSGGSGNYSSGSNLPSYYTFRVIKSDGSGDGFPANSVVLWGTASNPTIESGWTQHGGSVGKFVRGASSGGSSAGGGSHSHSSSGNHTHGGGGGSHTHPAGTSGTSNTGAPGYTGKGGQGGGCEENINNESVSSNHTHSIPAAGSGTAAGTANAAGGGSSGGTSIEAPYISVWGVTNSSDSWLEGGYGFISGESVPDDWVICNGSNSTINMNGSKYIKLSASGGAVSGTGGSTSHNHSGPGSHGHPGGGSHSHTLASSCSGVTTLNTMSCGSWYSAAHPFYNINALIPNDHGHPFDSSTTTNAATGYYSSGTQGIAAASSVNPAYKTVTWIMAPEEPAAGGNVGMFGSNF